MDNKLIIIIVATIVATAIIVGGGVYLFQKSAFDNEKQQLQQQIDGLISQNDKKDLLKDDSDLSNDINQDGEFDKYEAYCDALIEKENKYYERISHCKESQYGLVVVEDDFIQMHSIGGMDVYKYTIGFIGEDESINMFINGDIFSFDGNLELIGMGLSHKNTGPNTDIFYYDKLQISTFIQSPNNLNEPVPISATYKCDGAISAVFPASHIGIKEGDSPNYYCDSNQANVRSQYEFSSSRGPYQSTGGGSQARWYKFYYKKVGDVHYFFAGAIGECIRSDCDILNDVSCYQADCYDYEGGTFERYDELSKKKTLDEILNRNETKEQIQKWDSFVDSL